MNRVVGLDGDTEQGKARRRRQRRCALGGRSSRSIVGEERSTRKSRRPGASPVRRSAQRRVPARRLAGEERRTGRDDRPEAPPGGETHEEGRPTICVLADGYGRREERGEGEERRER
jgi:hypothetical protein